LHPLVRLHLALRETRSVIRKPACALLALKTLFLLLTARSLGAAQAQTPVILISVDTLRADHLRCYQSARPPTPHIDSLTKGGTLFSQVNTPFPLTLPAHTALFTSTYPFANGVKDNGIPLKSSAATLAGVLKSAGYRTAAFVGSFVLDRRFGLSKGFDVYEGPLDLHSQTAAGAVERKQPGAQVARDAMHWIEKNSDASFFLFLHLYDLHTPYSLPPDPGLRHGETGYTAELAYIDQVLGDFLSFLDQRHLLQKSLIVFTSDHGEGLSEHGESSHGYFVYQSTLHVPLIVHWPSGARRLPADRVPEPASLLDVAPTILDAIGVARPASMMGRSLIKGGTGDVYSESTYARNHFGCATLRSLRQGSFKYIDGPKPELYDLATDPTELHNLYEQQRTKAASMRQLIGVVHANSPRSSAKSSSPDSETINTLRSLGYLSGSTSSNGPESHIDPKDRIADFERYIQAVALSSDGKLAESNVLLQKLNDTLPTVVDVKVSLGLNQQRQGDDSQAVQEFSRVIKMDPSNAAAHYQLGLSFLRLRRPAEAAAQLKAALALEPWNTRAEEALAEVYLQNQQFPEARAHLNHILSIEPENYTAHFNLAILAATGKDWNEAQRQLISALHADPRSTEAHNALGKIYLQHSDLARAGQQFQEAIRLQPNFGEAHYGLGLVLQKQGKSDEAAQEFRAAQESPH
jgi:choline-sulfatase